jgi:hypothetical protein
MVKAKALLLAGALCFGGSSLLMATSRTFTIDKPVMFGNVPVSAGTYRITTHRDGSTTIADLNHYADKRPIRCPGPCRPRPQVSDYAGTRNQNGNVDRVTAINLGRSDMSVQFPQQ